MSDITCPHCSASFSIGEIALSQLSQERDKMQKDFDKKMSLQLQEQKKSFEEETRKQRMKATEWKNKIQEDQKKREQEIQVELQAEKKKREISEQNELELRKKQEALLEREKKLELEKARAIEEEMRKQKLLWKEQEKQSLGKVLEEKDQESRRKELEYKKQQEQMNKTIDDLRRKAQQGSMQIQGDIQEDDLRDTLRSAFPIDTIEDVPTGVKGADILQTVRTPTGQEAGMIIWESKNTKSWSDDWLLKLKTDQRAVGANFPILVSVALPKGVSNFAMIDGVWVTHPQYVVPVTTLIRNNLQSLSLVRASTQGKDTKMEALYAYLSGDDFRMKIEGIVEAFTIMKADLDTERRAMERIWKKREKQLDSVISGTSGMYGNLEGIIGSALPKIGYFSLDSIASDDDSAL